MCYIDGEERPGYPKEQGCNCSHELPRYDVPVTLQHSLYFAGRSSRRTEPTSAAFIGLERGDQLTYARAYLVRADQFTEIIEQENKNVEKEDIRIDIETARRVGHSRMVLPKLDEYNRLVPQGWYDELIWVDDREGVPMLTFTASRWWPRYGKPSEQYLRTIYRGLRDSHKFTLDLAVAYLSDKPGISKKYRVDSLKTALAALPDQQILS